MRPRLTQLLHDLRKVDRGKEVAPAVLGDLLDFLFVRLAVRERDGAGDDLARGAGEVLVFGPGELGVSGEVEEGVAEEAKSLK